MKNDIENLKPKSEAAIRLEHQSAIARELAMQCLKECEGKTEEERRKIIFDTKERIISSLVKKGFDGEEIEEVVSNFNRILEHRELDRGEEAVENAVDFLHSSINKKIDEKTEKGDTSDLEDLEKKDGSAA